MSTYPDSTNTNTATDKEIIQLYTATHFPHFCGNFENGFSKETMKVRDLRVSTVNSIDFNSYLSQSESEGFRSFK